MKCPACGYDADGKNGLLGHVNGKAQHEDPGGAHKSLQGSSELEAAIGGDPPGGTSSTSDDRDGDDLEEPTGATDDDVQQAVQDAETDEYAEQWGQDTADDQDGATDDAGGLLGDVPNGWLLVGSAVVLVILLLILLESESGEEPIDVESTAEDVTDAPESPEDVPILEGAD